MIEVEPVFDSGTSSRDWITRIENIATKNIESVAVSQSAKRDRAKPPREFHSAGDSRAPLHWPRKTRLESRRVYPHARTKYFVSTRTAFVTSVAMTKLLSLLDEISIGPPPV